MRNAARRNRSNIEVDDNLCGQSVRVGPDDDTVSHVVVPRRQQQQKQQR